MDRNLILNYEERQTELNNEQMEPPDRHEGAAVFLRLAPASLMYAVLYTFCTYQNSMGITIPVWAAGTIAYVYFCIRRFGRELKKGSIPCMAYLLLLGISSFTTGNFRIVLLNELIFFLVLVGVVLHNFRDDKGWDFESYLGEIVRAVCGACSHVMKPFTDGNAFIRSRQRAKDRKARYVLLGICTAVPCILFLGMILMTADVVFANLVNELFEDFRFSGKLISILFPVLFGFFSAYCGISFAARGADRKRKEEAAGWEPVLAITVTGMIGLLYLVFCGIQIGYLFAGGHNLPEGITYAAYARSGFFQLLFICMLNLVLVLWVKKHFLQSRILDIILQIISSCTLVMTASSAWRMLLYIQAYQLTFLRAAVLTALAVIALLMGGTMIFIARPRFPFFRYGAAVTGAVYLIFSFSHVDYFIASYNLSRIGQSEVSVDYGYLSTLSTDAAPAVAAYVRKHEDQREQLNHGGWYRTYLYQNAIVLNDSCGRNFNLSHFVARHTLKDFAEYTGVN